MNNETNKDEGNNSGNVGSDAMAQENQPGNNGNEMNQDSNALRSEKMQQFMGKAKSYMRQHWKTGAMILGVGLVARLLMNRRKA